MDSGFPVFTIFAKNMKADSTSKQVKYRKLNSPNNCFVLIIKPYDPFVNLIANMMSL